MRKELRGALIGIGIGIGMVGASVLEILSNQPNLTADVFCSPTKDSMDPSADSYPAITVKLRDNWFRRNGLLGSRRVRVSAASPQKSESPFIWSTTGGVSPTAIKFTLYRPVLEQLWGNSNELELDAVVKPDIFGYQIPGFFSNQRVIATEKIRIDC